MKNLFLPYALAILAKEKGFDSDTKFFCYDSYNANIFEPITNAHIMDNNYATRYTTAPLCQQVTDWLREKHGLIISIMPQETTKEMELLYHFAIYKLETETEFGCGVVKLKYNLKSYNEALESAIEEALKLI